MSRFLLPLLFEGLRFMVFAAGLTWDQIQYAIQDAQDVFGGGDE